MTELSGTLDGVGLPALVRFLIGLKKSGSLRVSHADWQGEIVLAAGQITSANLGSRKGLSALDALAEVLPGANFAFESQSGPNGEQTIRLSDEALQAHLDELAARVERGESRLPSADAIPALVLKEDAPEGEAETLPLDRGMLQTLLVIDGERSVREIVAQRNSFDALWQIASLVEVGLVELRATGAPLTRIHASPAVVEDVRVPEQTLSEPPAPTQLIPEPSPDATTHCPQLGFDDDPSNSFARPTRLHRCFATGTPLSLSIDQQHELCLSEQFGTCPRLAMAGAAAAAVEPREPSRAPSDEPRIVRLPFGGRGAARAEREPMAAASSAPPEPAHLRPAPARPVEATQSARPTPLRARLHRPSDVPTANVRSAPAAAVLIEAPSPSAAPTPRPAQVPPSGRAVREAPLEEAPMARQIARVPVWLIAGAGVVLIVAAVVAVLLQANTLFTDQSIDPATLPNTSRVAAGTPVSVLTSARATAVPASVPASAPAAVVAVQPTSVAPTAAPATRPTPAPTAAQPQAGPANAIFDEHFINNDAGWPSDPQGIAWITNGSYRIAPHQTGVSAAIGAPITNLSPDVVVSATFRKLSGPVGGGYGIIVRDQAQGVRNGTTQDGQYYVLEAGDKGEVGIWRREADHWVDLLPWQHSDAVKAGAASNDLVVRAVGTTLTLSVNGTQVATTSDGTLTGGNVGLFVGGDGNQVAVDHFAIQMP